MKNTSSREEGELYKVVYEDKEITIRNRRRREVVIWDQEKKEIKNIESSILLACSKILPLGIEFNSNFSKNLLSLKRLTQIRDCRFWALNPTEAAYFASGKLNTESVLKFVFNVKFNMWSGSWKFILDKEQIVNQVKSVFLNGDLDLTEDRILFFWEKEKVDDDILEWTRITQPSRTTTVLLRFPNTAVASAAKTQVFEKANLLIGLLNQKKNELFTIENGDRNAHDHSEFKLTETTFPGCRIHDLIDPSRVACVPEVDHWVPAVVHTVTTDTPTTSISNKIWSVLDSIFTTPNVSLKFSSEIGGLPPSPTNLPLYRQLEVVLNAMAPMFSKMGANLTTNHTQNIHPKVLVKAQVYEFHSGEEYQGQLHREGLDEERITAVGLYYPLVDPGVQGGDLLLCSVVRGGCGSEFPAYESVAVRPGTAVVFNNTHCFHQLLKTHGEGLRIVVGFFVVDPFCPLPASDMVLVNMEAKADRILAELEGMVGIELPGPVREMIISFVVGDSEMRFDAFRSRRLKPTTIGKLTRSACD